MVHFRSYVRDTNERKLGAEGVIDNWHPKIEGNRTGPATYSRFGLALHERVP